MTDSSRQPVSVEKPGKAMGEPWPWPSEVHTKMSENHTEDGHFKCQFEKMEVLQFFSQLNQVSSFGIVVWDSKLLQHGNWGELGPF